LTGKRSCRHTSTDPPGHRVNNDTHQSGHRLCLQHIPCRGLPVWCPEMQRPSPGLRS
jgi:hypothetical protein